MVSLGKRMEELRTEREISRPALAAALGLPRMSIEKFETGRQTPTLEQQKKIAQYFGISMACLRGEEDSMSDWMTEGAFQDAPRHVEPRRPLRPQVVETAGDKGGSGAMAEAFLNSKKFQEVLKSTLLEVLASPEGQKLLKKAMNP